MPPSASPPSDLDALTEINVDDLLDAVGLARWRRTPLRRLLRGLLRRPARRFAGIAAEFDRQVALHGLAAGSAWMLRRMSGGLELRGAQHVPAEGPLCVLANHPGMTDTVALMASLAMRPDLRVIALDRPFLRALPAVSRQLLFVPEASGAGRLAVLRAGIHHLRQGGALLSFPAARIEPDPALQGPGPALDALGAWSPSFTLFTRHVPHTACVPAIVSQVLDARAQRHPLTRLRRRPDDRERLAAALQVALARYQGGTVRVAFGPALRAPAAAERDALPGALRQALARLIDPSLALA